MNILYIYNAHNGAVYEVPKPVRFASLHKLKTYLHENATHEVIGEENLILLTSFGIKLDFSMVNDMQELFLFDRRLFQENATSAILASYLAQEHPRAMAKPVSGSINCLGLVSEINRVTAQINVMFRALNIIFQFTTNFIFAAEKAFENYEKEFRLLSAKSLQKSWKRHYSALKALPTVRFRNSRPVQLAEFLSVSVLEKACLFVEEKMPRMQETNVQMASLVHETNRMKVAIDEKIGALRSQSVQKFRSKAELVELLKKKEDLTVALQAYELLQSAISFKAQMAEESGKILEWIALSQKKSVEVKNGCKKLFEKDDTLLAQIRKNEAVLSMTIDLPLLFGFILIERRRQFEWADYFSKGVVHNISEQVTILIEHEKKFQMLWNKRFGSLLQTLEPGVSMQAQVPSVDVTLFNSTPTPIFAWLDFQLERDDLAAYIEAMRVHQPEKSILLLERNFKDLVVSTEKLKSTTKIMASLSTTADYETQSKIIRHEGVDEDADLNQMKGLRCRIKKLEDLLHQHQYKNLQGWPVVRETKESKSVLFDSSSRSSKATTSEGFETNESKEMGKVDRPRITHHFSEPNNPIKLLGEKKVRTLDASGTIDKHLENIRLRRELKEMQAKMEVSEKTSKELRESEEKYRDLEKRYRESEKKCEETEKKYQELEKRYKESEQKNRDMETKNEEIVRIHHDSEKRYEDMESKYQESEKRYGNLENEYVESKKRCQESEKRCEDICMDLDKTRQEYQDLEQKNKDLEQKNRELEQKNSELEASEAASSKRKSALSEEITALELEISQVRKIAEQKSPDLDQCEVPKEDSDESMNFEIKSELTSLQSKLSEVKSVNSELLSNMRAKEAEFNTERLHFSSEVSQLNAQNDEIRAQLEAKTEDFEDLMEVMQGKSHKTDELMHSAMRSFVVMFQALGKLLASNMAFFYEFCEILESMGLLLVAETNLGVTEFRIRRVKGLRSKKEQNVAHEIDVGGVQKSFRSAVVYDMSQKFGWIRDFRGLKAGDEDTEELEAKVREHVALCSEYVSKIDDFVQTIMFRSDHSERGEGGGIGKNDKESGGQIGSDQIGSDQISHFGDSPEPFFLNAILKRFRDVEGFAKKLTKENRKSDKISVNNFQEGDLALFLPTKKENDQASPWAAFNLDAPHFFLHTTEELSDKEYILGRISRIEEHVSREGDNPYGLGEGIRWFSVSI